MSSPPDDTSHTRKRQSAQIFISYSRSDRLAVDQLFDDLRRRHYVLWMDVDEHGIEPGENWKQELIDQLTASEAVIACVSPDFLRSKFCRDEIEQAKKEKKPIFPVLVRRLDADQSLADMGLDEYQFVDLTLDYAAGLKRLTNVLPRPEFQLKVWWERFGWLAASLGGLLLVLLIVVLGSAVASSITTPTATPLPPTPTPFVREATGVGVAYFVVEDDSISREQADELVYSFSAQLDGQLQAVVDRMDYSIGFLYPDDVGYTRGDTAEERERSARQLVEGRNVDIVVYGLIRRDDDTQLIEILPEFTVLPNSFSNAAELTLGRRFGSAIRIVDNRNLEDQLSGRARALALIVDGLGAFIERQYQDSLTTFEAVRQLPDYDSLVGRDVLSVLIANAHLRLAATAAETCDRDVVLSNVDDAITEFEAASDLAEADYVRPYSGMAAAYFLKSRYLPEETAECVEWYDLDTLFQALDYIELANDQRDPAAALPVVNAAKLLNEARITYALCAMGITGALEDEDQAADLCDQFDGAVGELVDSYVESPNPSVAPFAANAYGFRGDIEQLRGSFRAAIDDYEQALEINEIAPYQRMVYTRYLGDAHSWLCQLEQASQNYEAARVLAVNLGYEAMAETYTALRDDMNAMMQENECE